MKQKNPIRNEIVYLWKKEKIPIRGPLRNPRPRPISVNLTLEQEKVINSDEGSHRMSGEISGKKFLNQRKEIKMSEFSGCTDFSDLEKAYGIKKNKKEAKKLQDTEKVTKTVKKKK
jgi:hypothetical protein